jgi:transposase-like protein
MRNILDKLPRDAQVEIKRRVRDVFYAPSLEMGQERAAEVLEDYRETYPAAMRSFNDDLEACLVYLRCPLVINAPFAPRICSSGPSRRAAGEPR